MLNKKLNYDWKMGEVANYMTSIVKLFYVKSFIMSKNTFATAIYPCINRYVNYDFAAVNIMWKWNFFCWVNRS